MLYDLQGKILSTEAIVSQAYAKGYTDADMIAAFMEAVDSKCAQLGMAGTSYLVPSGATPNGRSCPQDLLKLGTVVAASPTACRIWATASRDFKIKGPNARTMAISNNSIDSETGVGAALTADGYKYLGGKGGSWIVTAANRHRAGIYFADIDGAPCAISLMVTGADAYPAAVFFGMIVNIADMMAATIRGDTPVVGSDLAAAVAAGGGYAACVLPPNAAAYQNLADPAYLLGREYSISGNPTAQRVPASTTKTMTMLIALETALNLQMPIELTEGDCSVGGSGSTYYPGDILTLEDALCISMMESSNIMATAIGRVVGAMILEYKEVFS